MLRATTAARTRAAGARPFGAPRASAARLALYARRVTRTASATVAVLVPPLLLTLSACAGLEGRTEPAALDVIAARSEAVGVAAGLVYVTEIDGFDLAPQSVGVMGDDGMSAMYVGHGGSGVGTVMLTTSRTLDPSAVDCAALPDSAEAAQRCTVRRGTVVVLLEGQDVDAGTLRAAGKAVRVPTEAELGELFADAPGAPVERGDLPPVGDGAPVDPPGAGG
jgi:hypothetical protein